jgi:phosphatidylglycerophosphatase A
MRTEIDSTLKAGAMTTSDELLAKPGWRLLLSHPAHFVSFGFGSGLAPKAPGTFGTLVALPLYWLTAPLLSDRQFMLLLVTAFFIWYWTLLAFVLFRTFDILKPPPIRHFDSNWHGGLGVMFDDLLAALYALMCLALLKSALA